MENRSLGGNTAVKENRKKALAGNDVRVKPDDWIRQLLWSTLNWFNNCLELQVERSCVELDKGDERGRLKVASNLFSLHDWVKHGPIYGDGKCWRQTRFMREDHEFHLGILNLRFLWKILVERSSRRMDDWIWHSEEESGLEIEVLLLSACKQGEWR